MSIFFFSYSDFLCVFVRPFVRPSVSSSFSLSLSLSVFSVFSLLRFSFLQSKCKSICTICRSIIGNEPIDRARCCYVSRKCRKRSRVITKGTRDLYPIIARCFRRVRTVSRIVGNNLCFLLSIDF